MPRLEPEQIEHQTFPVSRRGYDTDKVGAFLQVVAAYYREAIRQAEARVAPQEEPPGRPFEELGEQVAAVLSTAARTAEELTTAADREAQRMKQAAATEAEEITRTATNQLTQARQVRATAQQEAEALLAEARDEATRLKQDAHTVSGRLEQNARDRAAKVEQVASEKVAAILAEARRRHDNLRRATQESADHLQSVEARLRKAREDLTGEQPALDVAERAVDDVAARTGDAEAPSGVDNGAPVAEGSTEELVSDVLEARPARRRRAPGGERSRSAGTGAKRPPRAAHKARSPE